eukprot:TRINITY_DN74018_c0_g1_i1.p1 TRINITY_DN74018_c0_g1~~TRINITY_DN74018_c0_g1_i1.p1  ORF type:complete len:868 (+),score=157.24 TRINITY_DN74018_c0_g1_i1:78-2681(+)
MNLPNYAKSKSLRDHKDALRIQDELKVPQWIYLRWVKQELDNEAACMELPFTILMLFAFSMMAMLCLAQSDVLSVEQAIESDIVDNANFAFSAYMGHKNLMDAHSFADIWSWLRLGFMPLVIQPTWSYSESRQSDIESVFNISYASSKAAREPSATWKMGLGSRALPITGDYLHYNRIIGGLRFRQQVAPASTDFCKFPDAGIPSEVWQRWYAKPCMPAYEELSFEPDTADGEDFQHPERVEWVTDLDNLDAVIAQLVDMEDGCAQLAAKNRTGCLCRWCDSQDPPSPWLDERAQRIEVGMASYNSAYGLVTLTGVNFWFSRGGRIHKRVELMSSWIFFLQPTLDNLPVLFFASVWILCLFYIMYHEIKEIYHVVMHPVHDGLFKTLWEEYMHFWNVVDWISIGEAILVVILFLHLAVQTTGLHSSIQAMFQSSDKGQLARGIAVKEFYTAFEKVCSTEKNFRVWLCIYPMIMMLRLFKSFAAQPRLAVVTDTIKMASQDMLHFVIVLSAVVFTLCLDAVLLFGRDLRDFGTLARSFHSCFRMMFGDWDWAPMERVNRLYAVVWFVVFMVLVVIILLNMMLAIIMDNYMSVKKHSGKAVTLGRQIAEMWRRRQMLRRKERVKLNDIWDAFEQYCGDEQHPKCDGKHEVTANSIRMIVPDIPESQAQRTLQNSWKDYLKATTVPFEFAHAKPMLAKLEENTRQIRNGLFFCYDRMTFYDTRAQANGQPIAEKDLPPELGNDELVMCLVQDEIEVLSQEAAATLAKLLGSLDERQIRIERKQEESQAVLRDLTNRLLRLQGQAGRLTGQLESLCSKKQRSNWNKNTPGGSGMPSLFDCRPHARDQPTSVIAGSSSSHEAAAAPSVAPEQ